MIGRSISFLVCCFHLICAYANPLPVQQAFQLSVNQSDTNTLQVTWHIAKGYYLYQERIHLTSTAPDVFTLQPLRLPKAQSKTDKQGKQHAIYTHQLSLFVPILTKTPGEASLTLQFQGCSSEGYCYPPQRRVFTLQIDTHLNVVNIAESAPVSLPTNEVTTLLTQHSLPLILISFLGFGLLLAFTPCILPMIPVLSGILLSRGVSLSSQQAFLLALSYVLGLSSTYAVIGVVFALLGSNLQVIFQSLWMHAILAALLVLLALSMFDLYELKSPLFLQTWFARFSKKQIGHSYSSSALMGSLSTLVLSPCVTPPLLGALAYIANTGNLILGGSALFCLGFGSGIPLLLISTSTAHYLPKAGPWMRGVKFFFGILLLGLALKLLIDFIPRMHAPQKDVVTSLSDLQSQLKQHAGQPIILDFYADWCTSCKHMEATLQTPTLKAALKPFHFITVDLTANDEYTRELMQTYRVIAPPAFLFLDKQGKEMKIQRIDGEVSADFFIKHISR